MVALAGRRRFARRGVIGDHMERGAAGRLARRLTQARMALGWEHLWPLLWPVWAIVGVFVALSLLDVWSLLPGWTHAALLALFAGLAGVACWRAWRRFRLPIRSAARRRLERDSGIPHRPLTTVRFGDKSQDV